MTKYILHGGEISRPSVHNQNYFREMVKGLSEPVKILLVYFAREKNRWREFMDYDTEKFKVAANGKKVECILANNNPAKLLSQVKQSDIIYIIGGRDKALQKGFDSLEDLGKLFHGKVVAGSSAGANMLGRYYYDVENEKVEKGLDVIPIKILSHYKGSKYSGNDERRRERLENYGEDLKIYLLSETKYAVIEY
jgi:peptidase E